MEKSRLKAPFPYFGGKSKIAHIVWQALGQPKHYIEPFFGSGAVLLGRPGNARYIESVNDKDGFVCNVWRSLQFSPDETAKWCDWPVNHADLSARKMTLIKNEERLLENLIADDKWHDPVMAGYWIWASSCWIGSGLTRIGGIPRLTDGGNGVHAICKRPHISHGGKGVHAVGQIPHLTNGGKGVHAACNQNIYDWFNRLSARLRYVRVVCGDWTRVCGGNWQDKIGTCGMFFDPPYGIADRDTSVYHHDSTTVAADVMSWCAERGANERYRIVLAGYEEYQTLVDNHGWTSERWKANGGYANSTSGASRGKENRHREMLYYSPFCCKTNNVQEML